MRLLCIIDEARYIFTPDTRLTYTRAMADDQPTNALPMPIVDAAELGLTKTYLRINLKWDAVDELSRFVKIKMDATVPIGDFEELRKRRFSHVPKMALMRTLKTMGVTKIGKTIRYRENETKEQYCYTVSAKKCIGVVTRQRAKRLVHI
jgi:2-methylaconitate cis-trans-isomerase PrpF